jgi:nucleoside 2-deoxyribosyltransferase
MFNPHQKLVYVAGPLSADTEYQKTLNVRFAERVAQELWRMDFSVICPHKNTEHFDGCVMKEDWEVWLRGDLKQISRCDGVVMLPKWEKSKGAVVEHDFAKERGIPVFYWQTDKEELEMWSDTIG